jgi:hypothetical protein
MSDDRPLAAVRQLFGPGLLVVLVVVVAIVGPLGYAMTGDVGLTWVVPGAILWTLLFAYVAARTGKSHLGWGLAGGLICGTVWALGEIVAHQLLARSLGLWTTLLIVALCAGLGAGALVGASFGRANSADGERNHRIVAQVLGAGFGFSTGVFFVASDLLMTFWLKLAFILVGSLAGFATAVLGRHLGLAFRPSVLFFDQLWPYLREMGIPLAAFAVGYFCLTLAFAGFYGTAWRLDPKSIQGLPPSPQFWDFVYFSLMTASTANTDIRAVSRAAQVLTSIEVILGMGWLIVVFGALSAHLAPRLEAIASKLHSTQKPDDARGHADEQAKAAS